MPPAPPMGGGVPQPPAYQPAPPVAPAPQPQAQPAPAPAPQANGLVTATTGDLFNNGNPVAIIVTGTQLVILSSTGAPILVENVPGLKHALVGDFDGDGTQDLALFSETHVWIARFNQMGAVHSGKVAMESVPTHMVTAPFTHDGRAVIMATTGEKIAFCVLHPSKGLVEVSSTSVPAMEP